MGFSKFRKKICFDRADLENQSDYVRFSKWNLLVRRAFSDRNTRRIFYYFYQSDICIIRREAD